MIPLPGELAPLFFPPDACPPQLYLLDPEDAAAAPETGHAPEEILIRLRGLAPFFPGEKETDTTRKLLAVLPERRLLLPVPRWLAVLLVPDKLPALPAAFYRKVFSIMPPPEFFLGPHAGFHPSTLFGQLLTRGALTPDMLLGLLSLPGLGGFLRSLSPRVRQDLEVMRASRGEPAPGWMAVSALLFRLNAFALLQEESPGPWSLLQKCARALLAAARLPGNDPALVFAGLESGTAVLRDCGNPLLVRAFAPFPEETARFFSEIFSARKWRQLNEDAAALPPDLLESGCARFELLYRVRLRQAERRPLFERDLVAFLKREAAPDSRRFLLLAAGINRLASGLAAMPDAVREAFLAPCDGELAQLLSGIFSGKIVLQGPERGREAMERLAAEWRVLELAGLWGG